MWQILNGVQLLLARLTAARAAYLDAAITSRAAAADYTAARASRLDYLDGYISTVNTNASNASASAANAAAQTVYSGYSAAYWAYYAEYYAALLYNNGVTIGRTLTQGSFSTTQGTLQTALNSDGKGTLKYLNIPSVASFNGGRCVITIDSAVLIDYTIPAGSAGLYLNMPGSSGGGIALVSAIPHSLDIDFKTSLLVQLQSDGTRTLTAYWGYNM